MTIEDALAHHQAGRLAEAEAAWRAVLEGDPDNPGVLHNLGVLRATAGDTEDAIALFDTAIKLVPSYASAHFNRAMGLNALGRPDEAAAALRRTVALEPDHYAAHRALGFLWMALGRRDRAMDHFARTFDLRRGEDRTGIANASLTRTTRGKLQHDADQLRHLAIGHSEAARFEALARSFEAIAGALDTDLDNDAVVDLTDGQLEILGDSYNTAYYLAEAPEIISGAVNPALDRATIVEGFTARSPGAVWFDGFLSPRALGLLRRYLLNSTIWYDFSHIGGCLASYLEDGLASPLMLQIADEIRAALPEILSDHPLTQIWAFKAIGVQRGIDVHADDGAVSINFWVTPDGANEDPDSGGLAIYGKQPPPGWKISDYESDTARIRDFLGNDEAGRIVVPYRENRAILFDSRLFHESDAPRFKPGYENRRINITMLFGRKSP